MVDYQLNFVKWYCELSTIIQIVFLRVQQNFWGFALKSFYNLE